MRGAVNAPEEVFSAHTERFTQRKALVYWWYQVGLLYSSERQVGVPSPLMIDAECEDKRNKGQEKVG